MITNGKNKYQVFSENVERRILFNERMGFERCKLICKLTPRLTICTQYMVNFWKQYHDWGQKTLRKACIEWVYEETGASKICYETLPLKYAEYDTTAWLYEAMPSACVHTHMHATWHKFMKNTHQSKDPDQENTCSQITAATTSPYNNRHSLCVKLRLGKKNRQQATHFVHLGRFQMTSAASFEKVTNMLTN